MTGLIGFCKVLALGAFMESAAVTTLARGCWGRFSLPASLLAEGAGGETRSNEAPLLEGRMLLNIVDG